MLGEASGAAKKEEVDFKSASQGKSVLYTEREPCPECKDLLEAQLRAEDEVFYSIEYNESKRMTVLLGGLLSIVQTTLGTQEKKPEMPGPEPELELRGTDPEPEPTLVEPEAVVVPLRRGPSGPSAYRNLQPGVPRLNAIRMGRSEAVGALIQRGFPEGFSKKITALIWSNMVVEYLKYLKHLEKTNLVVFPV